MYIITVNVGQPKLQIMSFVRPDDMPTLAPAVHKTLLLTSHTVSLMSELDMILHNIPSSELEDIYRMDVHLEYNCGGFQWVLGNGGGGFWTGRKAGEEERVKFGRVVEIVDDMMENSKEEE